MFDIPKHIQSSLCFCLRMNSYSSSDLTWVPLVGQEDAFKNEGASYPAPVSKKILLNKLGPGDEIMARCLAVKGVGRDHAKFSPVSVAFYKLLPSIEINGIVRGELAKKLQKSFAKGVIAVRMDCLSFCHFPHNCALLLFLEGSGNLKVHKPYFADP